MSAVEIGNEYGPKPAREISAQRFDDMLGVLPPCKWVGHGTGQESFHVSEFLSGNIVSWFVQLNGRYFQIDDVCTLTHRELIAKAAACEPAPAAPADDVHEFFGAPISVYTRAQGIADGMLIDVSERAREAGFRWPVAMTSAAWSDCVAWREEQNKLKGTAQDEAGRLSDVINMASYRMRAAARDGREGSNVRLVFHVICTPPEGRARKPVKTELCLHVGPGDAGEPVLTIMLPLED